MLHIVINLYLQPLGFDGAAIATSLYRWICFFLLAIVIVIRKSFIKRAFMSDTQIVNEVLKIDLAFDSNSVDSDSEVESLLNSNDGSSNKNDIYNDDLDLIPEQDSEDNWPPVTIKTVFSGWAPFLQLAIPGAASLFVEWFAYYDFLN